MNMNSHLLIRSLFLHLPFWAAALLITGAFLILTLVFYILLSRYSSPKEDHQLDLSSILVGVVGAVYGMLFGLVSVSLWENYNHLQNLVTDEANTLVSIVLNSEGFAPNTRKEISQTVKTYIDEVVNNEWKLMKYKQVSPKASRTLNSLLHILQKYQPRNEAESAFYSSAIDKINLAITTRGERINALCNSVPEPLLRILIIGSILLVYLFTLMVVKSSKNPRSLLSILIIVNLLMGFNLYLLFEFDNPFAEGRVYVDKIPFQQEVFNTLEN